MIVNVDKLSQVYYYVYAKPNYNEINMIIQHGKNIQKAQAVNVKIKEFKENMKMLGFDIIRAGNEKNLEKIYMLLNERGKEYEKIN